jgi:hypothetical protein
MLRLSDYLWFHFQINYDLPITKGKLVFTSTIFFTRQLLGDPEDKHFYLNPAMHSLITETIIDHKL